MTVEDDIFKLQNDVRDLQTHVAAWEDLIKTITEELKE